MRACCIDVQNHVVKEYAMTWENVDDTFLNEKSCFKNSMIQNMKKRKICYSHVCALADRLLTPPPVPLFIPTLFGMRTHSHTPINLG